MVALEELVSPEFVDSRSDCLLVVGDEGAWRPTVQLDKMVEYCEHGLPGLVNEDSYSSQQQP